jgi:hypothetical protein
MKMHGPSYKINGRVTGNVEMVGTMPYRRIGYRKYVLGMWNKSVSQHKDVLRK